MKKVLSSLFLVLTFLVTTTQAQVLPDSAYGQPFTLLAAVSLKKGEGCTQATKRAHYPLTYEECLKLLEKHGIYRRVDDSIMMMPVAKDAYLPVGTMLAYVKTKKGSGWTLTDTD